ncbi:MAG: PIN domain-containing protein [Acidobacteria bacterium]|nr:PIN domain-containing protein [Acidobacteriota bacterium]
MRVLVDVNVVLNVLLDREPHVAASSAVWTAIETGAVEGLLAAHAITTIHYPVRKEQGPARVRRTVGARLRVFGMAPVDEDVLQEALHLPGADFEDSVSAVAARSAGCELIVTRDPKGYRGGPVRALAPEASVPILNAR